MYRRAAVSAAVLALAGCAGPAATDAVPGPSATPAPAFSTAVLITPTAGAYRAVEHLCEVVPANAISTGSPADGNPVVSVRHSTGSSGTSTEMTCAQAFDEGVLLVSAVVSDHHPMQGRYAELRRTHATMTRLSDIPGLGTSAYSYIDNTSGPRVVVWDDNLLVTAGWAPAGSPRIPADIVRRLAGVCRHVMSGLRG